MPLGVLWRWICLRHACPLSWTGSSAGGRIQWQKQLMLFNRTGAPEGLCQPPWCLKGRVVKQVKAQQAQVTLVAPVWRGQSWYPVLLEMLWDYPRWIPPSQDPFLMTSNSVAMSFQPQPAVWTISGRSLLVKTFQAQLGISCWPPGGPSPSRPTIPTSINTKNITFILALCSCVVN